MTKPLLVIASPDDRMATMLVLRLVRQLEGQAEYEVFTEESAFRAYMAGKRTVDVLIVSDMWGRPASPGQRIGLELVIAGDGNAADVADRAASFCREREERRREGTQVLMVYSPSGGSGKTSLALGLSENLVRMGHKTIYIDAEYLQTFQFWLDEDEALSEGHSLFSGDQMDFWRDLQPLIRNRGFDYLLPFKESLAELKIDFTIFWHIVRCAVQSGVYDYLVLDTDSVWNSSKESLAELSDHVLVITDGRRDSLYKLDQLSGRLGSLSSENEGKYLFICSDYPCGRIPSSDSRTYDGRIGLAAGKPVAALKSVEQLACRFV